MNAMRRGTAYILALGTGLLAAAIATSALVAEGLRGTTQTLKESGRLARADAIAGLEVAGAAIANDQLWRTLNQPMVARVFPHGSNTRVWASDPTDSMLADDATERFRLRAWSTRGAARQGIIVEAVPDLRPHPSMRAALVASGTVSTASARLFADGGVASGSHVVAVTSSIEADVAAAGTITGTEYRGNNSAGTPMVHPPSVAGPIALMRRIGTAFPVTDIPSRRIELQVLGPGLNPYGKPDARGIYIIEAGGRTLEIRNARIVGTLVVTNTTGVRLSESVAMEPAEPGMPTLIVEGPLTIDTSGDDLRETIRTYNPVGAPYRGSADTDMTDAFACEILGLVHASGNVQLSGTVTIVGQLLTNSNVLVGPASIPTLVDGVVTAVQGTTSSLLGGLLGGLGGSSAASSDTIVSYGTTVRLWGVLGSPPALGYRWGPGFVIVPESVQRTIDE